MTQHQEKERKRGQSSSRNTGKIMQCAYRITTKKSNIIQVYGEGDFTE